MLDPPLVTVFLIYLRNNSGEQNFFIFYESFSIRIYRPKIILKKIGNEYNVYVPAKGSTTLEYLPDGKYEVTRHYDIDFNNFTFEASAGKTASITKESNGKYYLTFSSATVKDNQDITHSATIDYWRGYVDDMNNFWTYVNKANQGKVPDDKENVLNRDFKADTINQKWVTDITYIHVQKEGWTYLASVMDLYDRKIIGYAYGKHMTAELALEAVKNACLNVEDTTGIILHSDLGSQYTSDLFEEYMQTHGIIHSFSRKGNPYDNACIESFHSVMKKEEIYLHTYQDFEECRKALFEYIESWYNRQRIHSALGYKTPQQVEDEAIQAA